MFGVERRSKIISLLNERKSILVQEASEMFGVTEETIRRDLKALETQGLLVRTHGGAVLSEDSSLEAPLEIRQGINISGKDAIGREASMHVKDGDTIILDASTSSLFVAKHIKGKKNITVITNAEKVILELSGCYDINIISTGGIFRHKSLSYIGRAAEYTLGNYNADKVFLSCKGFSPDRGMTDSSEQESDIRKLMMKCSKEVIFLCDHTKYDKVGYVRTGSLQDINIIITDTALPPNWIASFNEAGVKTVVAP